MAQFTYRGNVSAKTFPFISNNWGRTVIVQQQDNTYNRAIASSEDADQDAGIPQIFYCHNVMPNAQGFQSVGYDTIIGATTPQVNVQDVYVLRDSSGNRAYLAVSTNGTYIINRGSGWSDPAFLVGVELPNPVVTVAYIQGKSYIYVQQQGCFTYNFLTNALDPVTLTALEPNKVNGIVAANGYLIAWMRALPPATFTITCNAGDLGAAVNSIDNLQINQVIDAPGIFPTGTIITGIIPPNVPLPGSSPQIVTDQAALIAATNATAYSQAATSAVAWSSTIDPTDFTPSLTTGAGGGQVEQAKGNITLCVTSPQGFMVFTENNTVAAVYTNNSRYPFNFREVLGSSGVNSFNLVAYAANANNVYAYTTSGFQVIGAAQAQVIFPDVTDFLSGQVFEDYDEESGNFVRQILSSTLKKRVTMISDRYLVLSYGINQFTHALVYDMAQKRFGKLKQTHATVVEYEDIADNVVEISKKSIAFVTSRAEFRVVNFVPNPTGNSSGVIMLGKYQYVRQRTLQLDTISVENVVNQANFKCRVLTSIDGKNPIVSTPTVIYSSGQLTQFGCRAIGINHSLLLTGNFQLNTLVLQFSLHGKR